MQVVNDSLILTASEAIVVAGVFGWCLIARDAANDPLEPIDVDHAIRLVRASHDLIVLSDVLREHPDFPKLCKIFSETVDGLIELGILEAQPFLRSVD